MMNIYDCFSPTILIIYRYFQFPSSRSTTERRASPGVLKRMHNEVASGEGPGSGRAVCHGGGRALGCGARQELRAARCLGQPRRLLELCAGPGEVHWLLQPLRLRRAAPAHPQPGPRRGAEGLRVTRALPGLSR